MNDDVTQNLIHALVDNLSGAHDDWDSLAMVLTFKTGRLSGTHGYAYSANGEVSAVASRPSAVTPAVMSYLASRYKPDELLPCSLLVQYSRESGKYDVTFEDTDSTRWSVTPANLDAMREELKPSL